VSLTSKEKKRLREDYLAELKETMSESANFTSQSKKQATGKVMVMCEMCEQLRTHTTEQCWKGRVICDKCGREHPTERCRAKQSSGAVSGEKAETGTKKVSLVSMFKKK